MARPGITYLDVEQAAIELQASDKNTTVDGIRALLGTGSKSTIAKHLKTWKVNGGIEATTHDVPQELMSLMKGLWERVNEKANARIDAIQDKANEEVQTVQLALEQQTTLYAQLNEKHHLLTQQFEALTLAHQTLNESLVQQKSYSAALSEKNIQLASQVTSLKEDNQQLHQHMEHAQTNLEHYQQTMQKQQTEQRLEVEKQQQNYEQSILELQQNIQKLQVQLQQTQQENQQQQNTHHELQLALKTQEAQTLQLNNTLSQRDHDIQQSLHSLKTLKAEKFHFEKLATKQRSEIVALEKEFAITTTKHQQVENAYQQANKIIQSLQDNLFDLSKDSVGT